MRGQESGGCFPTGRHYPGIAHLIRVAAAGLAEEHAADALLPDLPLCSIDTETTGRDPAVDRVVEVGLVLARGGVVSERKSWLVNPGCPIPKETSDVHGITDHDVKDAPAFGAIVPELLAALGGRVPLAYNAEFDRNMIHAELERAGTASSALPPAARRSVEWIDPLVWARELQREEKSRALGDVAARLGVELVRAHRATDDAEAALQVFTHFLRDSRVPRTYAALIQEQRRLARLQEDDRRMWRRA